MALISQSPARPDTTKAPCFDCQEKGTRKVAAPGKHGETIYLCETCYCQRFGWFYAEDRSCVIECLCGHLVNSGPQGPGWLKCFTCAPYTASTLPTVKDKPIRGTQGRLLE